MGLLKTVARYSEFYAKLLDPLFETNAIISSRMVRLNRFEATTAYPFLLNVYADYESQSLTDVQFADILDVLETFLIRRFICGVPTHGLNRTFAALYAQASKAPSLTDGVKAILGDKQFPGDKDFLDRFVACRLYAEGERRSKAKLILERLESSFGHKESIDPDVVTIEHIMPRTLTDWWKQELGDGWEAVHDTWLDTVGNLTLTGYNPELSNAEFPTKQAILKRSHLELNRDVAAAVRWDEATITCRGEALGNRGLAIWPDFSPKDHDPRVTSDIDDEEPELAKLLAARVLDRMGGDQGRVGSRRFRIMKVGDGKVVNIKYSKRHKDNYYWFGIHLTLWNDLNDAGATHIVFILGNSGYLTVPIAVVKEYLDTAITSPTAAGTVRHFHFNVADQPKLEFFTFGKPERISASQFFTSFT